MSKLNGEAKEWKPSATASVFVPKTQAPAPQLNTNAPVWQAPQVYMIDYILLLWVVLLILYDFI
jgi:hypothetical protein